MATTMFVTHPRVISVYEDDFAVQAYSIKYPWSMPKKTNDCSSSQTLWVFLPQQSYHFAPCCFFTYSNNLDTCSLLYQHIYLKCMKSHLFFYNPRKTAYIHVTGSAFMYVRGWVFFGEISF